MSKHRMERSKVPVRTIIRYWRYRLEVAIINMKQRKRR
jgi:hypothetical protein